MNATEYSFLFFGFLILIILVTTEVLKRVSGEAKRLPNLLIQFSSWIVGIAVSVFGWMLNIGFFDNLHLSWSMFYGFGAALAANGIADTKIIEKIFSLFNKK